jgi:hypothetical protein
MYIQFSQEHRAVCHKLFFYKGGGQVAGQSVTRLPGILINSYGTKHPILHCLALHEEFQEGTPALNEELLCATKGLYAMQFRSHHSVQ